MGWLKVLSAGVHWSSRTRWSVWRGCASQLVLGSVWCGTQSGLEHALGLQLHHIFVVANCDAKT
jgi:hypothetical protein